jgi:prepilin-type N-terminal cleavage/methylation domain-containing protein/prepilin-type processing-associated H-X9-DG protein
MATAMRVCLVKEQQGFTLIELLVVVSIIALMVSLLAPSLAKAQKHAEQIRCLSNALGGQTRDGVIPCVKLHRLNFPSERLLFADVESEASGCFWPVLRDGDRWVWRPWSWPPGASLQGITARHANGCNMSFADGHGGYFRWKDARTLQLIKGQIVDSTKASSDNRDLDYMVQVLTRPFPQEGADPNYGLSHP